MKLTFSIIAAAVAGAALVVGAVGYAFEFLSAYPVFNLSGDVKAAWLIGIFGACCAGFASDMRRLCDYLRP